MRVLILSLLLSVFTACADSKRGDGLQVSSSLSVPQGVAASISPVVHLYHVDFHRPPGDPSDSQQDIAVWGDGRIVWHDGRSLRQGQVDTSRIDELLQRLHSAGAWGDETVGYDNFGPDSAYDVVEVHLPDRTLTLRSWHALFEKNPNLVATSGGITSLNGRAREEVLAADTPEYRRFRRTWSDIEETVRGWVPTEGAAFAGSMPVRGDR